MNKPSDERIERVVNVLENYTSSTRGLETYTTIADKIIRADDSHLAKENERLKVLIGKYETQIEGYIKLGELVKQALQASEKG